MKRWATILMAAVLLIIVPPLFVQSVMYCRIISVTGICLLLWISEIVPPFVPTLLLWALVPLVLAPIDAKYTLPNVLSWAADPVMALFFGGFALGAATESTGFDRKLTQFALRSSGGSFKKFLLFTILITAFLSMWMSNIAAAALVLACLQPILKQFEDDNLLRRVTLIGVALGADFGGMATPIGTGPNAIAIASVSAVQPISFLSWMAFAFPLTIGMLALSFIYLAWRARHDGKDWTIDREGFKESDLDRRKESEHKPDATIFLIILAITVALWLSEPLHKVSAAVIALGSAAALFLTRVLARRDLLRIDWSTLLLIAGGITLGRLLEQSFMIKTLSMHVRLSDLDPTLSLFILCFASALLAALMSNTATAVLFIPLATAFIPAPSTAILIAISASFGIPFIISTPPNAMVFGKGGLRFGDLFWPGIVLMILGCLIVSTTGKAVLNFAGIP